MRPVTWTVVTVCVCCGASHQWQLPAPLLEDNATHVCGWQVPTYMHLLLLVQCQPGHGGRGCWGYRGSAWVMDSVDDAVRVLLRRDPHVCFAAGGRGADLGVGGLLGAGQCRTCLAPSCGCN